ETAGPSRPRQKLRRAETKLLHPFPSAIARRSAAAMGHLSRPPSVPPPVKFPSPPPLSAAEGTPFEDLEEPEFKTFEANIWELRRRG
ncbi:unnamed protein product, partial [Urochloa humidicola]